MQVKYILSSVLMAVASGVFAQDWNVNLIPDSLKNGSQTSVVRLCEITYTALPYKEGTAHFHTVVTVLNKRGDKFGAWSETTSDNRTALVNFCGKLYGANGKVIQKIKKSEIKTSRYSEYVATGTQTHYVESPTVMSYPYTIEYEWDLKYTGGILSYPTFSPIDGEGQSMQEATYTLNVDKGTDVIYREMMTTAKCVKTTEGNRDVYKWTMPAHKAIVEGSYEPYALYRYPIVLAHARDFSYGKYNGKFDNWNTFGKWSYDLTVGRDVLPQSEKDMVHSLTDNLATNKEKIEALYNYLGKKTRYVAIMLGIGGWQPMTAEEVSKTGFGDCKALSNFMHSMLKEVGIKSHITLISTKYSDLMPDFPNFQQLNHAILCVPDADTLWIDCTAADYLPFGSVPVSLRGHECILLKENGGEMVRIPAITASENTYKVTADITFDETMTMTGAHYSADCYGRYFQSMLGVTKKDDKAKSDALNNILDLSNSKLSNIIFENVSGDKPHVHTECDFVASYGQKNGSRLFVPMNLFTSVSKPKFKEGRITPIVVYSPANYADSIRIHLPANASLEGQIEPVNLQTEFGSFSSTCTLGDDKVLVIVQNVTLNSGVFPIEKKEQFAEFYEKVSKGLRSIVVIKNE